MRYLSLFSGAGGGDLAAQHLDGMTPVAYCEIDPKARSILDARMGDGTLKRAPVFVDVRRLTAEELTTVDVVVGGVPCQPFSIAGKRRGADDERNLWPEALRLVRETRAQHFFFENVPGLKSAGGGSFFYNLMQDIAAMGYSARWDIVSAQHVGAPHLRERLWIRGSKGQPTSPGMTFYGPSVKLPRAGRTSLAGVQYEEPIAPRPKVVRGKHAVPTPTANPMASNRNKNTTGPGSIGEYVQRTLFPTPTYGDAHLSHTPCAAQARIAEGKTTLSRFVATIPTPTASDAKSSGSRNRAGSKAHAATSLTDYVRRDGGKGRTYPTPVASDWKSGNVSDATAVARSNAGPLNPAWVEWLMGWPIGWTVLEPLPLDRFVEWRERMLVGGWWSQGTEVPMTAHDVKGRVARLRCLGNGQVPLSASFAWKRLALETA